MMRYKNLVVVVTFLFLNLALRGQQRQVLSVEEFIQQVRLYHPLAKQANLITDRAAASLLSAKGGFDPVFQLEADNKTFDGTNYYRYNNPEIKIPTTVGVDIKAGYENSTGIYKNTELTTGVASYMGIEIPLLNGLLIDKKRAGLQQAKIYQDQGDQERLSMINDLLYSAYVAYWQWAGSYQLYSTYSNYVAIAAKRTRLVKLTFEGGDRSLSDTIEAFTQLQNFQLMQTDALIDFKNSALNLSQFLWTEKSNPYLLPDSFVPDTVQFERLIPLRNIEETSAQLAQTHPEIRTYGFKLDVLEVERRLKFQSLLPTLNVRANLLSKDYFNYKGLDAAYFENNYKLGINIRMPLLLRQGRGDYKTTQVKIKEVTLQRADKLWQLQTKLSQYYNEAQLRQQQLEVGISTLRNYAALLRFEELRFSQGESSLFLVNSRENKALEMQQKLIELRVKYIKSMYAIDWASGLLR